MPAMLTVLDQLMVIVASLLFLAVGWAIGVRIEIRRQQAAKLAADAAGYGVLQQGICTEASFSGIGVPNCGASLISPNYRTHLAI